SLVNVFIIPVVEQLVICWSIFLIEENSFFESRKEIFRVVLGKINFTDFMFGCCQCRIQCQSLIIGSNCITTINQLTVSITHNQVYITIIEFFYLSSLVQLLNSVMGISLFGINV